MLRISGKGALFKRNIQKADISHDIDSCDMIIGIDEYLNGPEKDFDNAFIQFKKFYQRIYKKTGSKYIDWLREATYIYDLAGDDIIPDFEIYFFGHSLDVTDKDILTKLIRTKNSRVTIFYHCKKDLGNKIANLVKIIGQDELIERVHGECATIRFIEQQE